MFVRAGAEAVIRDIYSDKCKEKYDFHLIGFILYIAEAQKGSRQYKTLSEMWTGVVATNAIHEIAENV